MREQSTPQEPGSSGGLSGSRDTGKSREPGLRPRPSMSREPVAPGEPVAPREPAFRGAWTGVRRGADRIDAATPPDRDRAVDALRAFAILGVVLGHWLVTALVADGGTLRTSSPLHYLPWPA